MKVLSDGFASTVPMEDRSSVNSIDKTIILLCFLSIFLIDLIFIPQIILV